MFYTFHSKHLISIFVVLLRSFYFRFLLLLFFRPIFGAKFVRPNVFGVLYTIRSITKRFLLQILYYSSYIYSADDTVLFVLLLLFYSKKRWTWSLALLHLCDVAQSDHMHGRT